MLREIVASRENNMASHQFSNSALSIERNPPKNRPLTELDSNRQAQSDIRNVGADTSGPSGMDTFKINTLA